MEIVYLSYEIQTSHLMIDVMRGSRKILLFIESSNLSFFFFIIIEMPNKQKTQSLGSFIIQTPTTYTSGLIDTNNDDDLLSFPENIDNSLQSECNIIESVPQII